MKSRRIVLPETREALQNLYPAAFQNPGYLRLLEYLLFGTFVDKTNEDFLVIDARTLARLEGREGQVQSRNYVGKHMLEDFQRDVAPLIIENYQYTGGRARIVRRLEAPELSRILHREFTAPRVERTARGVYLETGRSPPKQSRIQATQARLARQEQAEHIAQELDANHPAAALLTFLNTQPTTALKRIIASNFDSAVSTVVNHPEMLLATKRYNLRLLHDVGQDLGHNPAPLYRPSLGDRTVRLFPVEGSYLSLSRDIRKALLSGCDEFDLNAAQLTLSAHIWKIPSLTAALGDRRLHLLGPWALLGQQAGLPIEGPIRPSFRQKVVLKRAVYALLFGAAEKTVQGYLLEGTEGVPGLTQAQVEQLMGSDLMRDILVARRDRQKQIQAEGGITTVFGKWVPLSPGKTGRDHRSLMAEEMQAYELYLLKPVVDYLLHIGSDEVTIAAWQHDGFTLHFKDNTKRARHNKHINQLVKDRAVNDLGMPKWQVELERVTLD
ncbi:hypothetical protein L1280_001531 [Deinococcus sp. HSC-46F16]|uniref:hypothetical protein n=1 Tax=Deinococcus sp. HSC-46F16 TaxID=2910968 RepID=UPI0020A05179|nr:hypothetical protein [Deinococcus sp. HSC-46F16]MCP2014394.1 hypothetical protein [Deinococcus sp. HSC-46F16]